MVSPRAEKPERVGAGCFWSRSRLKKKPGAGAGAAKTIILLVLYFLQFYLTSFREKNILPNLTNSQEPGVFGSFEPEPEPLEKKPGAGAGSAWEKNQEPRPLEKKVRSRNRSR